MIYLRKDADNADPIASGFTVLVGESGFSAALAVLRGGRLSLNICSSILTTCMVASNILISFTCPTTFTSRFLEVSSNKA